MTTMLNNMCMSNMFIHACRQGRLLMYLQPKFSISKNKIVGAEALVRILDDHSNIIPPAQIIPVLESTGVIDTLDNIMIEKSLNFKDAGLTKDGKSLQFQSMYHGSVLQKVISLIWQLLFRKNIIFHHSLLNLRLLNLFLLKIPTLLSTRQISSVHMVFL